MDNYNFDYYILNCGSGKVPSPYHSCSRDQYFIFIEPFSLNMNARVQSPAKLEDDIPLIDAMTANGKPIFSNKIKQELEFSDLYLFQLQPAIYSHSDDIEHLYWIGVLNNRIDAYDFTEGTYFNTYKNNSDNKVDAKTIRLDITKLSVIPLNKRLMFTLPGMTSTYIVHKSIAKPLIGLQASGLHLVPLMDWSIRFCMTI